MSTAQPTGGADGAASSVAPVHGRSFPSRWTWRAGVVAIAMASFFAGHMTTGIHNLPEIAATLPGDEAEFSRELDQRVQDRFPIGSRDKALIGELARQGFAPDWRERDYANAASFVRSGLLCTDTVRVIWRADDQGALTQVDGSYQSQCGF